MVDIWENIINNYGIEQPQHNFYLIFNYHEVKPSNKT